jgi:hypothetical protein
VNEKSILTCPRLPARLDVAQTGEILGFLPHEITVLMSAGLLPTLGKPAANGHKYFATTDILELAQDRNWLDKATRSISKHWQAKNRKSEGQRELAA